MRVLIIEDEESLAEALQYSLRKNNISADISLNGIEGEQLALLEKYNVIVLDRMLPGKDGIQILKNIREQGIKTPVLFLTAKDSVKDRIEGLDFGADDYLVKPFSKEELLARIRAISRRQLDVINNQIYQLRNAQFNALKGEIDVLGKVTKFTSKESQILEILLINKKMVVTKEQILEKIWGFNSDVELNNIEVYISYLRKKLIESGCSIEVETIRGSGYCISGV